MLHLLGFFLRENNNQPFNLIFSTYVYSTIQNRIIVVDIARAQYNRPWKVPIFIELMVDEMRNGIEGLIAASVCFRAGNGNWANCVTVWLFASIYFWYLFPWKKNTKVLLFHRWKKKKKNIKCYIKFGDESFCEIKQNISIFEFKKRIFLKIASQNTSHTSNKKSYPIDLLKLINTISILRYYNRIISLLVVEINVKNVHETFRSFICFPPRDTTL